MNGDADKQQAWWEAQPQGRPLSLGLVHLDRKGSTAEWSELPRADVQRRAERYYAGVVHLARIFDAARPLNWQGDGVMLFVPEGDDPSPVRAFQMAKLLWQRVRVDLNLPVRIAVHWGKVAWNPDTGQIRDQALDLCGHLQAAAPENAIALSEDVFLALPDKERRDVGPLGVTARDHIPAYVYPAVCAERKDPAAFLGESELDLWGAFRTYTASAEIRKLRYVGFRLAKRGPPTLDILDVFVPPQVDLPRRLRRPHPSESAGARRPAQGEEPGDEPPFAWLEEERAAAAPEAFGDVFARHRGLVVLGEPGSGKTTLLRWLAVMAAGGRYGLSRQLGACERLLPLPVSVGRLADIRRELREPASVADALAAYFCERSVGSRDDLSAFLQARLAAGQCLVLLDGLDEVRAEERHVVRGWLESFAAAFPRNRFVASSRRIGYVGVELPGGEEVTLRPFDDEQVERYVRAFTRAYRRWETGADDPAGADRAADELLGAVAGSARLHALARNPFLLSGIALIHRAEGRLPRHRVQLYEIFARCLCEAWSAARRLVAGPTAPDIPYEEEAVPVLGHLAFRMHRDYPAGRAPRDFVLETLRRALWSRKRVPEAEAGAAAKEFLSRAGDTVQLFLERGPGQWGFLHLTFQEFFAAVGLHADERFEAFARDHWFEPRWEEVLRLGVGYMALIQKRPVAARNFVEERRAAHCGPYPWVADTLRLQVPLATLLAAEAGDALPADAQTQIAEEFVRWASHFPCRLAERVRREVSLTDFSAPVAQAYIPLLKHEEPGVRWGAALALGELRSEAALTPLLDALRDEDRWVRRGAAEALGQLRSEAAIPHLLDALRDEDSSVSRRAACALGHLRAEAGLAHLLHALEDEDPGIRESAASGLGHLRREAALPHLLDALKDEDPEVRGSAAEALGQLGAEAVLPPLLDALKDGHCHVRGCGADALGRLGSEAALPNLLDALKDEDPFVRGSAADALGQLGADAALPTLLDALKDEAGYVRWSAARALGQLRVEAALPNLLDALKDEDASVRGGVVSALGQLRAEAAIPPLLAALKDEHPSVRGRAASALGHLGPEAALPPLLAALKDEDAFVRGSAADALGQLRAEPALPPLLAALKDEHASVRGSAADALVAILAELPPPSS